MIRGETSGSVSIDPHRKSIDTDPHGTRLRKNSIEIRGVARGMTHWVVKQILELSESENPIRLRPRAKTLFGAFQAADSSRFFLNRVT